MLPLANRALPEGITLWKHNAMNATSTQLPYTSIPPTDFLVCLQARASLSALKMSPLLKCKVCASLPAQRCGDAVFCYALLASPSGKALAHRKPKEPVLFCCLFNGRGSLRHRASFQPPQALCSLGSLQLHRNSHGAKRGPRSESAHRRVARQVPSEKSVFPT